jgi:2-octaprenyl-6-methoxyphenol hydroxylase
MIASETNRVRSHTSPDAAAERPESLTVADVLIVGGGFVGGALALALAKVGLTSVVIEAAKPESQRAADFDGRASAIALTSRRLLTAIGVWDEVAAEAEAIREIRVADAGSPLFLHYHHRDVGREPFGHMLENRTLRFGLARCLAASDRVRLLAPARLAGLDRDRAGVEARLAGGGRVRARLAVAADGRDSSVREAAGIRVTSWRYGQMAIVCTVAHQRPHNGIAHEHFLPAGPFAILPLTGNRSSIVWTERAELAPSIMALDDAGFLEELSRRFGDFLGSLAVVGPRWSYPLSLQYAATAVGRRLALVGDAAHAMHPIAGQGLNMGFRDVAALADVLAQAAADGRDLGDSAVLARYQRWRRFDNTLMLAATDGLTWLFSNDIAPIRLARDLGLAAVHRLPPLKRLFMRHAMGLLGDLPSLMRG